MVKNPGALVNFWESKKARRIRSEKVLKKSSSRMHSFSGHLCMAMLKTHLGLPCSV